MPRPLWDGVLVARRLGPDSRLTPGGPAHPHL